MSTQWRKFPEAPVLDFDKPRSEDAAAMQERGVLEGARLFDAYVEAEGGISDEDPGIFLDGAAQELVEDCGGGDMFDFFHGRSFVERGGGVFRCSGSFFFVVGVFG